MHKTQIQYDSTADTKGADEIKAALNSTYAIASVGIATLEMLETLLPAAAKEVEHESSKVTGHFMKVMDYLGQRGEPVPPEIREAMDGIVVGMQFQDRNTQIMENVTCILERYRNMLDEVCNDVKNMRDGNVATGKNIAHAIEHILSSIRLSDIRSRYKEALVKAKVHSQEENTASLPEQQDNKEIEIF